MNLRPTALALALMTLPLATPSFAHHSTAMYNMANPVTVSGTVKRFEWTNPHAYIYLEVTDEKGAKAEMCQVSMKFFGKTIDNLAKGFVATLHPVAVKRIADLQREGYLYIKP